MVSVPIMDQCLCVLDTFSVTREITGPPLPFWHPPCIDRYGNDMFHLMFYYARRNYRYFQDVHKPINSPKGNRTETFPSIRLFS